MDFNRYLLDSLSVIENTKVLNPEPVITAIVTALKNKKPLLVCGNGGSASDAMHIAGELVGRFKLERSPYKVICLVDNPAVITAWSNDYDYKTVFSRQVEAYGENGAVLIGISTSGNSPNVVEAFETARAMGVITVGLTGEGGGRMAELSDYLLAVPSRNTPLIQQSHICIYHYLCMGIESRMVA